MPIVKWPILIIGKLADDRPIIGAPLGQTPAKNDKRRTQDKFTELTDIS